LTMAYDKVFYDKYLRKDRHDATRARLYDEWREGLSEPEKASCDEALNKLQSKWHLGEQQAKALLVQCILFVHMKVDEQDKWRRHGETVRAQFEYAYAGLLTREIEQALA